MTTTGVLAITCVIELVVIVHQYARLVRAGRDVYFWRQIYNAQTQYAARADERLREADRAKQHMQHTIHKLRADLGERKP